MIDLGHEVPDIVLALLLVIDVGGRAVPPHDRALGVKQGRSAAQMPRISLVEGEQAVLHLISNAGFTSPEPGFRRGAPVIGMNDPFPIRSADRPISLAAGAGVLDAAIGTRRPDELRQAVGQKPEMFLAASQLLF